MAFVRVNGAAVGGGPLWLGVHRGRRGGCLHWRTSMPSWNKTWQGGEGPSMNEHEIRYVLREGFAVAMQTEQGIKGITLIHN